MLSSFMDLPNKYPISPVIKRLKSWRVRNKLYQRQAIDALTSRGFDLALSTLQQWEIGYRTQSSQSELELKQFLKDHPVITDAKKYGRYVDGPKVSAEQRVEMRKLRAEGAT